MWVLEMVVKRRKLELWRIGEIRFGVDCWMSWEDDEMNLLIYKMVVNLDNS